MVGRVGLRGLSCTVLLPLRAIGYLCPCIQNLVGDANPRGRITAKCMVKIQVNRPLGMVLQDRLIFEIMRRALTSMRLLRAAHGTRRCAVSATGTN